MALPLLTAPLVARELGPVDRGIYAACVGVLVLSPVILGFGIPLSVRRRAALDQGTDAVRTVYRLAGLWAIPAVAIAFGAIHYFIPGLSSPARVLFILAMAATCLQALSLCLQSVLVVRQDYLGVGLVQASLNMTIAVVTLIAWLIGVLSIPILLAAFCAGSVVTAVIAVLRTRISPRGQITPARRLYREGVSYAGSQIAEVGANSIVQILALTVVGAASTGFFAIGMTVAGIPLVFGYSIGIAAYKEAATAGVAELERIVGTAYRAAVAIGIGAATILALATPWAVPLLFGDDFEAAVFPTLILLLGSILTVPNYVASQLLAATGRGWIMTIAQCVGLLTSIGLLVIGGLIVEGPVAGAMLAAGAVVSGRVASAAVSLVALPIRAATGYPRPRDFAAGARILLRGRLDSI